MKLFEWLALIAQPDGTQTIWRGEPNDWLTYCSQCGAKMEWKERNAGFDGNTGKRDIEVTAWCPNSYDIPDWRKHLWHGATVGYKYRP